MNKIFAKLGLTSLALLPSLAMAAPAVADTSDDAPAVEQVTPMDYAQAGAWLCRPEQQDACEQVATATSIAADGSLTRDAFAPAGDPPIDCFYVYPTVSRDPTANADAVAKEAAGHICASNEEDGVAKVIEELVASD